MHPNVHSSNVYNGQTVEGAEMPFNRRMDKKDAHVHNGVLLSHQKGWMPTSTSTWMELAEIMLSEVSQTGKDNYDMVSLICGT